MAYHVPAAPYPPNKPPQMHQLPSMHSGESQTGGRSEVLAASTGQSSRRRSSAKIPGLKRAFSSPNVRSLTAGENASMSPTDKKRNKLGYHRTAVACGHCRRRKIRCIPANEDPNGRCQNCIRLKKDCHFFPVDQEGPHSGRRTRSGSQPDSSVTEGEGSVSSSSPRVLASSTLDQIKNVNGEIGTPPLTDDGSGYHTFGQSGSAGTANDFAHPRGYDYRHGYDAPPHGLYRYSGHPRGIHVTERPNFDSSTNQYYPPHDRTGYQNPYTSPPLSGSMKPSPHSNAHQFPQPSPQGSEFSWAPQPPVRSLSIADTEDLHHMYPNYRAQTFSTLSSRMGAPGELPHDHPSLIHRDSQHHTYPNQYQAHGYPQMHLPTTMTWTSTIPTQIPPAPVSTSEQYSSSWYPATQSGLPYVREEEDPAQGAHIQAHGQQRFRPNPG